MPKKQLKGVVVSNKMQKTVIVAVTRLKEHHLYKKKYKVTKRYQAHDEKDQYQVNDQVIIGEIRPVSSNKRWNVLRKI